MLACVVALGTAAAGAQTQPAAKGDGGKVTKPPHAAPAKPATGQRLGSSAAPGDEDEQSDMILLQEPFRPGPAMPVNVTRGR